ncbi:MAG: exonuclease domain-containing protein [Candidatus Paceibacterota bacterium]|jgi:DNA polymerase III epsilon subunit-like protein
MQNIIFFDTETTGNTEKDFLCQIAYKTSDESFSGLYKPPIKIPPEASAVHHITNKMLADKVAFKESPDYKKIKELFENENSIVVAHNTIFDLVMIEKEDIKPKKFICTLRLARFLDSEGKIDRYNLQYLRYFLDLDIEATAHDAMGDVLVLEKLYERLKKKLMENEKLDENKAIEKMVEISSHPSLFKYINFGKHSGKEIQEIARIDPSYLEWLLKSKLESDQIDEDWIYTLKHYLNK